MSSVPLQSPKCVGCKKTPAQLAEYRWPAKDAHMTRDAYVRSQEGTYNSATNAFACTECYMQMGMPSSSGVRGWRAGDPVQRARC